MNGVRWAGAVAALALLSACSVPGGPGGPSPSAPAPAGTAPSAAPAPGTVTIEVGTPGVASPSGSAKPSVWPSATETAAAQALLAQHGLAGKSAEDVIAALEASTEKRPLALQAVVKPGVLELSDGQTTGTLPLPADKFYVAVAPFRKSNPKCTFHNLATDQGELPNFTFRLVIGDANHSPLVDQEVTTGANGYVGFWLPRDRKGFITGVAADAAGVIDYSTRVNSWTCRNQLRLNPYVQPTPTP